MSHELRTPATLILGPIEKLISENKVPQLLQQELMLINKNAQRLLYLINQLMDFRKIQNDKMHLEITQNSMNEFLDIMVKVFLPLAKSKNLQIIVKPESNEGETWFDFHMLEIVMYNLLANAITNTNPGGLIEISFELNQVNPKNGKICVTDTGTGISKEEQKKVFNRFYQIDTGPVVYNGTGIGLALTKEVVELHHGTIHLESEPGKGTTFTVEIPVRKMSFKENELSDNQSNLSLRLLDKIQLIEGEITTSQSTPNILLRRKINQKDRPTVLIVEDNVELRNFIADRLYKHYNVFEAPDGQKGFELSNKYQPEVIVSDIVMPEKDGLEFCKAVKSNLNTSHIPVILLTAKGNTEVEIRGMKFGADRYMSKPFKFDLLKANIDNLIETRKKLFETFRLQQKIDISILATTKTDDDFLKKILLIIEENLEDSEFNVSALADKMMMSRGYLHKKLVALANLTPVDFINNIRLKKSFELLHNTKMNISEIGYAVGYSDPKYFSRLFKKQYGKPPTEFHRNL